MENKQIRTIRVWEKDSPEEWAPMQGYEDFYEISSNGRCRGLERETKFGNQTKVYPIRILTPKRRKGKYSSYILCNENHNHKTHQIHRLVAKHFIQNPKKKRCVNHKDGNKENNAAYNLEWNTHKENSQHAIKNGLNNNKGESCHLSILTKKQVIEIRVKYIPRIYTQKMLAKEYKVSFRAIAHIIQKTSWKHIA